MKWLKLFQIIFLFTISIACFGQRTPSADLQKYYVQKTERYLDKQKQLSSYYSIDQDGIRIYSSALAKKNNQPEFSISWEQVKQLKNNLSAYLPDKLWEIYQSGHFINHTSTKKDQQQIGISGCRIALDPGHLATDMEMAELEKKHIKIKNDSVHGIPDSLEISEGMLTYATAELLKAKLQKEGAIVMMTRNGDKTAFGMTYWDWKKKYLRSAVDSLFSIGELNAGQKKYFNSSNAKDRDIFRVIFRDLELAKRAELINNFQPDLCAVIHYNVDETNKEWAKPGTKNFNMCFVGGAFMRNDLSKKSQRFEFFRLMVTDQLENSIELSSSVITAFEKELQVPTATVEDASYLKEGCIPTGTKGVYCRNLQLTRYIHAPVVYGETLCQDDPVECKQLGACTDKKNNPRVQQVAEAYFKGIQDYLIHR